MKPIILQSFSDIFLHDASLLELSKVNNKLVGALAVRACVSYNHETAARA